MSPASITALERSPHALAALLAAVPSAEVLAVDGPRDVVVDHFVQDSREVGPGGMFVATRGSSWDGHAFIPTAVARGASVIVGESAFDASAAPPFAGTLVQVKDGLVALAWLSAAWYGHPGRDVQVLATTGTNGKTTTTYLLEAILRSWGRKVGLVSTVEIHIGDERAPTIFTTPPSPEFQHLLALMRERGCSHAVVEASSHGLHQRRIAAFPVAVAGFTNLTRDHLDYHVTMEAYEEAKALLFGELAERACICIDEPAGRRLAALFQARFPSDGARLLTVSTRGEPASLSAHDVRSDLGGVHARVAAVESFDLSTPLIGRHNLENALVAIGMARLAGVPHTTILHALSSATGAPGRLQRVARADGRGPICFVDYAHTPDALENVLSALGPLVHGQGGALACVFGAGGDRDKGKRPEMAAVAQRRADRVIATSDNPRTEDPEAILDDIVAGFSPGFAFRRIADRKVAIAEAVAACDERDAVLIAGKGHEDYQIMGTTKHPFDDVAVARAALAAREAIMTPLTARQIGHLVDGVVRGDAARVFTTLFTDSRKPIAGGLFVALKGERFDGHDFLAEVIRAGACGVVVRRGCSVDPTATSIEVDDPQRALTTLGAALRNRHPGRFVAVTGSVGKTTAKDMLAAALAAFGKVGKTPGNLNNHIGVPLTLAGLDGDEAFAVIELGMSAPGEIARLAQIARPQVALVTRAAAAHLEYFADVDAIADAKAELYEHLAPDGIAVVNADDPRMLARARAFAGERLVTYGRTPAEALGAKAPRQHVQIIGADHTSERLVAMLAVGADSFDVHVSALGRHNAENAAAAIACCVALDLDPRRAAAALGEGFRPAKHRMQLVKSRDLAVLDDCYNANPASTRAALETFGDLFARIPLSHRLAVVGSMRELGPTADALHADIGSLAASVAGTVIATGPHAQALVAAAEGAVTLAAPDVAALLPAIADWARSHPQGAMLLKGSRGERLERVLDLLLPGAVSPSAAVAAGGH